MVAASRSRYIGLKPSSDQPIKILEFNSPVFNKFKYTGEERRENQFHKIRAIDKIYVILLVVEYSFYYIIASKSDCTLVA